MQIKKAKNSKTNSYLLLFLEIVLKNFIQYSYVEISKKFRVTNRSKVFICEKIFKNEIVFNLTSAEN